MRVRQVRDAYARRADEYTSLFGSMSDVHELDVQWVSAWAASVSGPVIDAGCGPGHWTEFLRKQGSDVEGVDLVPAFIEQAKARFPETPFRVASLSNLGVPDAYAAGILAWYSLIHVPPTDMPVVLQEFARCIAPGGSLLLGFFEGASLEPFPHAVTTAFFWPVDELAGLLKAAGFEIDQTDNRTDQGRRPHAAIRARRITAKCILASAAVRALPAYGHSTRLET